MKTSAILTISIVVVLSCLSCKNNTPTAENIIANETSAQDEPDTLSYKFGLSKIGTTVLLPLSGMECALNGKIIGMDDWKEYFHSGRYTLVHFINNKKCSICLMKMLFWWDDFADDLGRDRIDYCFIVHPDHIYSLDELVCELNKIYFSFPVFFDFNGLFINANECFATLQMPDCVLLNEEKNIVAVGNMDDPAKMYQDFRSVVF